MNKANLIGCVAASLLALLMNNANSSEDSNSAKPDTVLSLIKQDARVGQIQVEWLLDRDWRLNKEMLSVASKIKSGDTVKLASKLLNSVIDQDLGGSSWKELPVAFYCHIPRVIVVTTNGASEKRTGNGRDCNK